MKTPSLKALRVAILATGCALGLMIAGVLVHAYPSSEAVRLRNSLLITNDREALSDWTPRQVPRSFRVEHLAIPEPLSSAAKAVAATTDGTDLEVARALASHLIQHATKGGRIDSFDVDVTYKTIIRDGTGYCSDIVDSYIALTEAVGLFVRPWAFSFDGFGGLGHIVVEIFDRQANHWVMLDVFNDVMPLDRKTRANLSVSEFRSYFLADHDRIVFVPIGPGRQEFAIYEKLIKYYADGIDEWYLWNGNNVVSRAHSRLVSGAGLIAEEFAELVAIALDQFPQIVPIESNTNRDSLKHMSGVRSWLMIALFLGMSLALLLALEIIIYLYLRYLLPGKSRGAAPEVFFPAIPPGGAKK